MKNNIIFSILLIISTCLSAVAGGGWTPKKGTGFFKFGLSAIRANGFYNPNGRIIDITTISLYTASIYAEYGITNRLSGVLYAPLFVRSTINSVEFRQTGNTISGDELNAIGDFDLGVKYAFVYNKKIAVSGSITFGIPLGETQGGNSEILQTGDGEFNQLFKLEASRSFYPKPMYISTSIGFNNRTKGYSEEFHFGFEIGYTFNEKLTTILKVYNVSSFENGEPSDLTSNGVFSNNTEYFSYGPEISYKLKENFGISGSAAYALSGKRILAAPNYNLGVFITL